MYVYMSIITVVFVLLDGRKDKIDRIMIPELRKLNHILYSSLLIVAAVVFADDSDWMRTYFIHADTLSPNLLIILKDLKLLLLLGRV